MLMFALLGMIALATIQWMLTDSCIFCYSKNFNISEALSASAAAIAVLATIYGYYQHKQDEKARMTAEYNEKYRTDEHINQVVEYLISLDPDDKEKPAKEGSHVDSKTINKRELFLRFIEEVQYLVDKDLIDKEEAYDLFGYYANLAVKSDKKFLSDLKDNTSSKSDDEENNWETLYKFVDNYRQYKNNKK